jgi:hypothetical protein
VERGPHLGWVEACGKLSGIDLAHECNDWGDSKRFVLVWQIMPGTEHSQRPQVDLLLALAHCRLHNGLVILVALASREAKGLRDE